MKQEQLAQFVVDGITYKTGYIDAKERKIIYRYFHDGVPMIMWIEKHKGKYPEIIVVNTRFQLIDGKKVSCPVSTLEEFIATGQAKRRGRPKKYTAEETAGSAGMAGTAADKED